MEDDAYLENLNQFVLDEKHIITYRWLSSLLQVSADHAKMMLAEFVRRKGDSVHCTYIISGYKQLSAHSEEEADDNDEQPEEPVKGWCMRLITQENLEEAKGEFDRITGLHVYSVEAAAPADTATIWQAESDKLKELLTKDTNESENYLSNRWSAIKSDFIQRREFSETSFKPVYLSPAKKVAEPKWADSFQKLEKRQSSNAKRKVELPTVSRKSSGGASKKSKSTKSKAKPKVKPKKKGSITSFMKQTSIGTAAAKVVPKKRVVVPKGGEIDSFFKRQAPAAPPVHPSEMPKEEPSPFGSDEPSQKRKKSGPVDADEDSDSSLHFDADDDADDDFEVLNIGHVESDEGMELDEQKSSEKDQGSPYVAVELNEGEGENAEDGEDEEEDLMAGIEDFEVNDVGEEEAKDQQTAFEDLHFDVEKRAAPKREKTRRKVEKTYIDEEGFSVTKLVWVEDEVADERPPTPVKPKKKKKTEPQKPSEPEPQHEETSKQSKGKKKGKSAYSIYCDEQKLLLAKEHPDKKPKELRQLMNASWKAMSKEEKQPYDELSRNSKGLTPKKRKAPAKKKKKRGKKSAYNFFVSSRMKELKDDSKHAEKAFGELTKIISAEWKEVTAEQKEPYQQLAKEYNKKLEEEQQAEVAVDDKMQQQDEDGGDEKVEEDEEATQKKKKKTAKKAKKDPTAGSMSITSFFTKQ